MYATSALLDRALAKLLLTRLKEGGSGSRAKTPGSKTHPGLQEQVLEPAAARTNLELKTDCRVLGLRETLKTFAVDVRLGPDTAYSRLVVSKDRKSVPYGVTQQNLPDNPERFYCYNIVLSSQCISSGRHYWEVEIGDRSEWGLGVCEENVDRKEVVYLFPPYGFWVIRLRKGTEYWAGTDEYPLLPLSVPPHRVGVFLDCEAHDVSFYNVTDGGSHIFTFPHYPFPGRLLPHFSPCYSIGTNNTTPLTICALDGEG